MKIIKNDRNPQLFLQQQQNICIKLKVQLNEEK